MRVPNLKGRSLSVVTYRPLAGPAGRPAAQQVHGQCANGRGSGPAGNGKPAMHEHFTACGRPRSGRPATRMAGPVATDSDSFDLMSMFNGKYQHARAWLFSSLSIELCIAGHRRLPLPRRLRRTVLFGSASLERPLVCGAPVLAPYCNPRV